MILHKKVGLYTWVPELLGNSDGKVGFYPYFAPMSSQSTKPIGQGKDQDKAIFACLLDEVVQKGLGRPLQKLDKGSAIDLAETIQATIGEQLIGWKSLQNYTKWRVGEKETTSIPYRRTLNGLVQFLWEKDSHEGLWHQYRQQKMPEIEQNISPGNAPISSHQVAPLYTSNLSTRVNLGAYKRMLIWTGLASGFVTASVTILAYQLTGYHNLSSGLSIDQVVPLVFMSQMLCGGVAGWLIGITLDKLRNTDTLRRSVLIWIGVCLSSFVLFFILKGIASRDSLLVSGNLAHYILGEPNFENIATALAGMAGIVLVVKTLKNNLFPSLKHRLKIALVGGLLGGVIFGFILILFNLSIAMGWLQEYDVFISPGIFKVSFGRHYRLPFFVILGFLYVLVTLSAVFWVKPDPVQDGTTPPAVPEPPTNNK